jgi:hypothetical protein
MHVQKERGERLEKHMKPQIKKSDLYVPDKEKLHLLLVVKRFSFIGNRRNVRQNS